MSAKNYYLKYLKYKGKYVKLKTQLGGTVKLVDINDLILTDRIKEVVLKYKEYRNDSESEEEYICRINKYKYEPSDTGPLRFENKLSSTINFVNEMKKYLDEPDEEDENTKFIKALQLDENTDNIVNMDKLIKCYSLNEINGNECFFLTVKYNDSNDRYELNNTIPPIMIKKNKDNKYEICDGRHRVAAHIIKNINYINVKIKRGVEADE